jgi:hypothetical protein
MFGRVLVRRSVATVGKRCHECSGPFGMVRHHLVTFNSWIFFCSKRCKDEHRRHRQQEVRRRKFRELLHALVIRVSIRRGSWGQVQPTGPLSKQPTVARPRLTFQ